MKHMLYVLMVVSGGLDLYAEDSAVASTNQIEVVEENVRVDEYPYFLPIYGQQAYERGYDLPLPVGVGISHMYAKRDIQVESVRIGLNSAPSVEVGDFAAIDVATRVNTTVARLDAWLFPFMNLYTFLGQVDNHSEVTLSAKVPTIGGGSTTVSVDADIDLDGPTYGGGVVLAGGYDDFFLTLDANFFSAELTGSLTEKFDGSTYAARAGWNGELFDKPTRLWLGASYWMTESVVSGSIPTGIGNAVIHFEVDQKPVNPENYNIGFYVELSRKIHLVVDYGINFDDAQTFLVELNYRFF